MRVLEQLLKLEGDARRFHLLRGDTDEVEKSRKMTDVYVEATKIFIPRDVMETDVVQNENLLFAPFPKVWIEWETYENGSAGLLVICDKESNDSGMLVCSIPDPMGRIRTAALVFKIVRGEDTFLQLGPSPTDTNPPPERGMEVWGKAFMDVLCYVNLPHATEIVPEAPISGFRRERLRKAGITGEIKFGTIRLKVSREEAKRISQTAEPPSHHKALHRVRAHARTYKSGKVVIVRSHTRGDERYGVKISDYVVEK